MRMLRELTVGILSVLVLVGVARGADPSWPKELTFAAGRASTSRTAT